MIKSSELRIGNLLFYKNTKDIAKVELIHLKHFDCRDEYGSFTPNGNYEPIPLSEEILLKVGFELAKDSFRGYLSPSFRNSQRIRIRTTNSGNFIYKLNKETNPLYIESLHQLQNLFYSLSGGQEINTSELTKND